MAYRMIPDDGQQPVQSRVHAGRPAHQPHPFPAFPFPVGPHRLRQLFLPLLHTVRTDPPFSPPHTLLGVSC